jgi:large subunit ribosomal protein L9
MKVILYTDIEKLGVVGDVVEVKSGYARNYLFPKKLALEVNKHNLELMAVKKKKIQKQIELEKLSATEQKNKLEELKLKIEKKAGESDVLFGSVSVMEIEKKLEESGISIERKKLHLDEPIKRLGNYTCKVKLFQDIEAELKIEVVKEEEVEDKE